MDSFRSAVKSGKVILHNMTYDQRYIIKAKIVKTRLVSLHDLQKPYKRNA